jgi:hypothetical protein
VPADGTSGTKRAPATRPLTMEDERRGARRKSLQIYIFWRIRRGGTAGSGSAHEASLRGR